jgi:hypothetical protein
LPAVGTALRRNALCSISGIHRFIEDGIDFKGAGPGCPGEFNVAMCHSCQLIVSIPARRGDCTQDWDKSVAHDFSLKKKNKHLVMLN